MNCGHDRESDLRDLVRDAEDSDNPQGCSVPNSIRESALMELRCRGYYLHTITRMRLETYKTHPSYEK